MTRAEQKVREYSFRYLLSVLNVILSVREISLDLSPFALAEHGMRFFLFFLAFLVQILSASP